MKRLPFIATVYALGSLVRIAARLDRA